MKCKFCNTENADDALFCKNCGKQLDAKRLCPKCDVEVEDDVVFCPKCGERIEDIDKKVCAQAPQVTSTVAVAESQQENTSEIGVSNNKSSSWKKWVELSGSILGIVLVATVIFCFLFTSLVVKTSYSLGSAETEKLNLSYFIDMAKRFSDIADLFDGYSVLAYILMLILTMGLYGALGIVLFILTIVAIVKYVAVFRNQVNSRAADNITYSIFFVYIIGTILLRALWASDTVVKSGLEITQRYSVAFSAETKFGIVFTILLFCLHMGCRIAVKGKELAKATNICAVVFSVVGTILGFVAMFYIGSSIIGYGRTIEYSSESATTGLLMFWLQVRESGNGANWYTSGMRLITAFAALVVFLAMQKTAICRSLGNAIDKNTKEVKLSQNICLIILSAYILLIVAVEISACLGENDSLLKNLGYKGVYIPLVVVIVMTVLQLGLMIANNIVNKEVKKLQE